MTSPQPVPQFVVCSECGLAWELHGKKPSAAVCIRLLREELALARRPQWSYTTGGFATNCVITTAVNSSSKTA